MSNKKNAKRAKKGTASRTKQAPKQQAVTRQQATKDDAEEQETKGYGRKALLVIAVLLALWVIKSVIGGGQ